MPPAIYDETGGAGHVHPLIGWRLAAGPPHREQEIGKKDEGRARPARSLDGDLDVGQAAAPPRARFLST
jgi:hypothetical protein